jgi:2',5'-phosphodiesterase
MQDVFKPPLAARHSQFKTMLDASPALTEALQKVTTIAQMLLLVPRGTADPCSSSSSSSSSSHQPAAAPLLVINTHLFFHPYAPHIRSLHTAAILEEAAAALAEWQQQAQQQQQQQQQPLAPLDSLQTGPVEPHLLQQLTRLPKPTLLFCGDLNSDLNDGVPGEDLHGIGVGIFGSEHLTWRLCV